MPEPIASTPQPTLLFAATWTARILTAPPLIAPVRQFTWPERVPGEEDALARGALLLDVRPSAGGSFLATCALGFRDPRALSGVWSCPQPDQLLAIAGGYAYLADTLAPERVHFLMPRPVVSIVAAPGDHRLLLAGFHTVAAIGPDGPAWETPRLSWEGLTLDGVRDGKLHGTGWDMRTDRDVPFTVDLETGAHTGGAFGN